MSYDAPQFVPPGHYYSPIVDLNSLSNRHTNKKILDINFNDKKQLNTFKALSPYLTPFPFTNEKSNNGHRFYFENGMFGCFDGAILYGMCGAVKPTQVIEVGSGHSSCVFLDAMDKGWIHTLTMIEPYPERVKSLMNPSDQNNSNVKLLEHDIQKIDVSLFESLNPGDFLFIDSTHVVKTGSDVCYIFFEILPRVKPGVYIHFHDIFAQFEYPEEWVSEGRNWNELFILQAFLMNNWNYEIIFFNDYFRPRHINLIENISPLMIQYPGCSIYLLKH